MGSRGEDDAVVSAAHTFKVAIVHAPGRPVVGAVHRHPQALWFGEAGSVFTGRERGLHDGAGEERAGGRVGGVVGEVHVRDPGIARGG